MARPVPAPNVQELKGLPPHVSRAAAAPAFKGGRPAMPKYFSGEAKAEWKRLVGELLRRGTLTKIDRGILELHCVTYAHWRECIAEIVKGGAFVDVPVMDASGNVFMRRKKNIATDEAAKDAAAMRGFLIQLGATPAARKTQQLTREGAKRNEPAKPGSVGALFDAEEK